MNRRLLFAVVAAVAAICLTNTSRADAAMFGLFASNGGGCEAYAGCDSGPSDCGSCAAKSCCKPKRCCKPKCCAPKPKCCDPCNSCCSTPILDYLRNLFSPCCQDDCGGPAPSCGCGG